MEDEKIIQTTSKLMKRSVISELTLIQSLWAGHGHLYRAKATGSGVNSIIIKEIKFSSNQNHKYNKDSLFAQERKKQSYKNELLWYKSLENQNNKFLTPKYITSEETENGIILILEDLKPKGFFPIESPSLNIINSILAWLASLHAKYLNLPDPSFLTRGNYWNLPTRPDEFEALSDINKNYAIEIDSALTNANYQTLIHGDAKLANFLSSGKYIAGVDFQYVGTGIGTQDLMYFLSSIGDENLPRNEESYLHTYFNYLENSLKIYHPSFQKFSSLKKEWETLYLYAWADFYRFLLGWNPHHYKVDEFSLKKYEYICKILRGEKITP